MTDTHTCPPFGMKSYNCQQKTYWHRSMRAPRKSACGHCSPSGGTPGTRRACRSPAVGPTQWHQQVFTGTSALPNTFSQPPSRERPGKTRSILCFSMVIKSGTMYQCAVGDSTPGPPFRVAGPQGERLPVLEPEHLARRRRRVPAPTPGTVSPTALAHR